MTIKEIVTGPDSLPYNPLCSALIERAAKGVRPWQMTHFQGRWEKVNSRVMLSGVITRPSLSSLLGYSIARCNFIAFSTSERSWSLSVPIYFDNLALSTARI